MDVSIDHDRCVGHAKCVMAAPSVFDLDEDGFAVVRVEHPSTDHHDAVEDAAWGCPEQAVVVSREGGAIS